MAAAAHDEETKLKGLLEDKKFFKSCPAVSVDPLMWHVLADSPSEWKVVWNQLRVQQAACTLFITNVLFENDEQSYATLATIDVTIECPNSPSVVVRFEKLFKLNLDGGKQASVKELLILMQNLSDAQTFWQWVHKHSKPKQIKFGVIDSSIPAIGLIANVTSKGDLLTFVVTRHRNMLGAQQPRKLQVKTASSRASPDGKHVLVQSGPNTWSVFEVQPTVNKFSVPQMDLEELQRILALQA